MRMKINRPTLWIDCLGAAVTAGVVLAIASYVAVPLRQRSEKQDVLASCAAAREDLTDAQMELERLRKQAELLRDRLLEVGRLPRTAPQIDVHERLAAMASRCRIKIVSYTPAQDREYPGLIEKRLAFEASGTTQDILRFLKAVEEDESWMDIGFLRISTSTIADARPNDRMLSFGISLFSVAETKAPDGAVIATPPGRGS